jgi:hypothetical protein
VHGSLRAANEPRTGAISQPLLQGAFMKFIVPVVDSKRPGGGGGGGGVITMCALCSEDPRFCGDPA